LLLFKFLTVPLFILLITLAGKKWGSEIAGTLGGFPVVAGPIIFFLTLEQGVGFGINASISAIYGSVGLLVFGLAYGWSCQLFNPFICIVISLFSWFITAYSIALLPTNMYWAISITLFFLILIPKLLPIIEEQVRPVQNLKDLPIRVVVGALLTFSITTLAQELGDIWSGILSVFPIISLVLAVFTHLTLGKKHVVQIFRGMSKGLYSFITYFIIYAMMIKTYSIWASMLVAILSSLVCQLLIQKIQLKKVISLSKYK
jgi:uncharacterized membrane protein (GlpM family)